MTLSEYQNRLIEEIQKAIDDFNQKIPKKQQALFGEVLQIVKDLEIKNGQFINTTANLKKLAELQSRLKNTVFDGAFKKMLQDFVDAFSKVAMIQQKYFKALNPDWKPDEVYQLFTKLAKDAVVKAMQQQIDQKFISMVEEILRQNITTGGSYQDLVRQMQEVILTGSTGHPGILSNLADTITTNALNQFSANYTQMVAKDLGLEWFMYVGSNKATTREFCEFLTEKKYVHISQLPEILKGKIDGHQVKINPKTKLWYGAIDGTNESNFQTNRGGHKCGHQFIPVAAAVVPMEIRNKIKGI